MKTKTHRPDLKSIREALAALHPGAAHQAGVAPDPNIIFAPATHANALDPERVLVIGNRGVGKSFWSAVLVHAETRKKVAEIFPRLKLDKLEAVLGFYEDAGKDEGPAPSPLMLQSLMKVAAQPEQIWRGVLLKALQTQIKIDLPNSLRDTIVWASNNIEQVEATLRNADRHFLDKGKTFLVVFDALDRLGRDWTSISALSEGMLRFALDVRGFRAIHAKIFMRTDQANDDSLFRFADASKIRADSVKLVWQRAELFGLLYNQLLADKSANPSLREIASRAGRFDFNDRLLNDAEFQEEVFYVIAGEYMGAGAKRGRTYSWLYDHLADAFGETSPRSFLTALERAANHRPAPIDTAIDHYGIRAGVQDASEIRVTQLKEDYDWIDSVLIALEELEVPCDPDVFMKRWRERGTVEKIRANSKKSHTLLPLELERSKINLEGSLLVALSNIGVVEFRTESRINMPDIFRVAARIKRARRRTSTPRNAAPLSLRAQFYSSMSRPRLHGSSCASPRPQIIIVRQPEPPPSPSSCFPAPDQPSRSPEPESRHVVVHALAFACAEVGLAPDADIAIAGDGLIEGLPGRQVRGSRSVT